MNGPIADAGVDPHRHHVLVCLDGSACSETALPYVASIARTFGSAVTLVRVMASPRAGHSGPPASDVLSWELSRREVGLYLERLQQATAQALEQPVQVRLEQGSAAERIVDLAREIGADLIVLSSHGESAGSAPNLGSTALHVLATARSSVFVVHASPGAGGVHPKRVLVPLDGSPRAESVLPTAARIARAYRAELLLVHVVHEPPPTLVLHAPEDLALVHELAMHLELSGSRYLQGLRDRLTHESTVVRTLVVRHANERRALLDVSRKEQVDLIVLSAHGAACDPLHSFGGVTSELLIHLQLPMLVLQDLSEQDSLGKPEGPRSSAPPLRASFPPEAE